MSTVMTGFVVAVLAGWFLASVIRNIGPLRRLIFGRRRLEFVPDWALFARPRVEDLVLLRRNVLADGTVTRWSEVQTAGARHLWNLLWNPELSARRATLALASAFDTSDSGRSGEVLRPRQGTEPAIELMTGIPYLTFLRYLSDSSGPTVEATQFMIVALREQAITGRFGTESGGRVVFVSEMHTVHPPDDQRRTGETIATDIPV